MDGDFCESYTSSVPLFDEGGIAAKFGLTSADTASPCEKKKNPGRDYSYRIEGDYLTGPARIDIETGKARAVCFVVNIAPKTEDGRTYEETAEKRIRWMGDEVEAKLKSFLDANPSSQKQNRPGM